MMLVCDQALLSRRDGDGGVLVHTGEWLSAEERARALEHDAHWLFPLAGAYVQVALEACLASFRRRPDGGPVPAFVDPNFGNEIERRLPLYQTWYVGWAVYHTERSFRYSPKLDAVVVGTSGESSYRFSRDHRGVFVEFVPAFRQG